jgi:hypothetical protein
MGNEIKINKTKSTFGYRERNLSDIRFINGKRIEYECYEERTEYINHEVRTGYDERSTFDRVEYYYSKEIKFKDGQIIKEKNIDHKEYTEFYDERWRIAPDERRESKYTIKITKRCIYYN